MSGVDLVLIGRNEGNRLSRSLAAARSEARRVVYVDSGSRDDSVARARAAGALVVELDAAIPFTAARARNAGFDRLGPERTAVVQFLDGDCTLIPGWLATGAAFLEDHPRYGLVTGWAEEDDAGASVYKRLLDREWRGPTGDIAACSGNMMVRAEAFAAVGGFDAGLIVAEDEDLCRRLEKSGWRLHRLGVEMCIHDGGRPGFRAWWTRSDRAGHGFAQIGLRHPEHYRGERRRTLVYGLVLPLLILAFAPVAPKVSLGLLALYLLSFTRTALRFVRQGDEVVSAAGQAALITVSKFPNLVGMARYFWRRLTGRQMRLIEYK